MNDSFDAPQPDVAPPSKSKPSFQDQRRTSGMAIGSLVLGLLSLVFTCFTGAFGLILGVIVVRRISASQNQLHGKGIAIAGIITSILFSLISMVVTLSGLWVYRIHARDAVSSHNLRMMGLATLNYESTFQRLPTDIYDRETGKPQLSWRVGILPYLEHSDLRDRFHLDEPWDSPHNLEMARNHMPRIFERPGLELEPGMTVYKRVVGNGALFNAPDPNNPRGENGVRLSDVRDGTSNTILFVECHPDEAELWTKPGSDHEFNPAQPFAGLGASRFPNLILAMASGDVYVLPVASIPEETLKAAFTRAGGEEIRIRDDFGATLK